MSLIIRLVFAALIGLIVLSPGYTRSDTSSGEHQNLERWDDWPRKNLQQDWNYLFHPERINQWYGGRVPDVGPRGWAERGTGRAQYREIPGGPEYSY